MRPATSPTDSVHIIVAVDYPRMRQLIVDYLGTNDIRVTSLPDAHGVEDALPRETIDLLIVAVKPPGDDGMRLTQRLRDDSDLPIIMLAGRSDEADRVIPGDGWTVRLRRLIRQCRVQLAGRISKRAAVRAESRPNYLSFPAAQRRSLRACDRDAQVVRLRKKPGMDPSREILFARSAVLTTSSLPQRSAANFQTGT
ncbi:response regulator [Cupriavidus basilensis]|uniref:response regulator n=1 Tax=Cupriavidus basilensis TaxID=68895 RepID=UPI0009DB153A